MPVPRMTAYHEVVPLRDVPGSDVRRVLELVLEHLNVELVRECTPDYTAYALRPTAPR